MNEGKIISILCEAFDGNLSTNYAIIQDSKRRSRIRNLIRYALELAKRKGEVFLDQDETSAALITYSNRTLNVWVQTKLDIQLLYYSIGFSGAGKALSREKYIKSHHPKTDYIYLWFIGTGVSKQGKGYGSKLLTQVIERSNRFTMPIYLETSTPENLPFYKRNGFEIYHEKKIHNSGFLTYFLRKENEK